MDKTLADSLNTLEDDLSQLETEGDLLRRASYWLTKHLDCSFVLFYADQKNSPVGQVKYYGEQRKSIVHLPDVVNERVRYAPETKGLLVHADGALSMPIVYGEFVYGYLFVGKNVDERPYSAEEMQLLGPVTRIVHNALLSHSADKACQEKEKLRLAMNRYISPEVLDMVTNADRSSLFKGEKVYASLLYSHIPISVFMDDRKDVKDPLKVLNTYLNEMTQVILSLGGTIGHYDGASILAYFGALKPLPDHAVRCCLASLRMKRMEGIIVEQLASEGLTVNNLSARIGINTGHVIAGNVGSLSRMDFSVIGQNVEDTLTIESIAEKCHLSRGILIGKETQEHVGKCFDTRLCQETRSFAEEKLLPLYELVDVNPGTIPLYTNFLVEEPDPQPNSDGIAEL